MRTLPAKLFLEIRHPRRLRSDALPPVLRQVGKLMDYYETDETALAVAGAKANTWKRYGEK